MKYAYEFIHFRKIKITSNGCISMYLKTRILFSIIVLFLQFNNLFGQQVIERKNSSKSIAVILKINGENNQITNTEIFSFNIYDGIAKKINEARPPKGSDILKIKAFNEMDEIIFDGYFENPLNHNLESFEEDGTINNSTISNTTGYINIRFPISNATHEIKINCYSLKNNDKEERVSTLKFKIQ